MKKGLSILLAIALIVSAFSGTVFAADSSDYDNWQGVFGGTAITIGEHYYGDATGTVIANYVKGKGDYVVSIELFGLQAGREYELIFTKLVDGKWTPKTICWFTTDTEGNANFAIQGWKTDSEGMNWIEPTALNSHFNVFSYQNGRQYVLSTYVGRTDYPLEAVDSNRGE